MPATVQPPTTRRQAPIRLRSLGYAGAVKITGGPVAERISNARETYLGLSPDRILHGFREQAGQPAPGDAMTGWASITSQATFGQWVSGMARMGAVLGDQALSARAVELVDGWAATIGDDGDASMRFYSWEKAVCGLVDTAVYAGHDDSLRLLERITDFASRTFDRSRVPATPRDFAGDGPADTLEWYTLAENLHRGYLAGASDAVEDFAKVWHYDAYWQHFTGRPQLGVDWPASPWLHAYSHVNTFASAAAAYEVNGDPTLLDVLRNAHDYLTETQCYATGGFGPGELSVPQDGTLGAALEWRTDSAEIVCGSWAAFKLCSALLAFTGEARFGDWVERLVYSGIGATTPVHPSGRSPYYHDYRLGVCTKLPHWDDWPCCSGTYIQAVAHVPDLVYFADDKGLAVNLFLPSEVSWTHAGQPVTVVQRTTFPEADDTQLTVHVNIPTVFTVKIRVPGWTSGLRIAVNDQPVDLPAAPGQWAEITREWADGDTATVTLGTTLRPVPVDRQHPNRVAFTYGPVVLAQDAIWTAPLTTAIPWPAVDLDRALVRNSEKLRWTPVQPGTHRQRTGDLLPLADVADRVPYRLYLDLDHARLI